MADLVVIAYDSEQRAAEVRAELLKMAGEYLVDIEDAAIAIHKQNGKVKLQQIHDLTAAGAIGGSFWGVLIGLLVLHPLLGLVVGAGAGAAAGAFSDVGINDNFMKELGGKLTPGTSALFVLSSKMTSERVLERLKNSGGHVMQTSLSHEDEERLRKAIGDK
ncbi:DUF1269 domain-containing protein [Halodesulfovibrio marinisediminis]|uniref:Uncharacterized membrane protein n=1 Tax=Halodesulfovibrio marinisediminis DSM 17456 TaxID=1121457 RepID=A0A1N6IBA4_9BACT|nr:DUF1269 domain-containing protein [Halodesulfovibrio marinisediminis]SIO29302.1 Uncharacterized membrane protein [Halodesulfovibrio marinisediminis DSM 17456]